MLHGSCLVLVSGVYPVVRWTIYRAFSCGLSSGFCATMQVAVWILAACQLYRSFGWRMLNCRVLPKNVSFWHMFSRQCACLQCYINACARAHTHTHTYTRAHAHTTHTLTHTRARASTLTHGRACARTRAHTHTHTHTQTQTHAHAQMLTDRQWKTLTRIGT